MISIIYNILGAIMLGWYSAIRWTMFANHTTYWWAYEPINMITAIASIIFIVPTLFRIKAVHDYLDKKHSYSYIIGGLFFFFLGMFLFYRNIYYTWEDFVDLPTNYAKQTFYIIVDLMMVGYTGIFIYKYLQYVHKKLKGILESD